MTAPRRSGAEQATVRGLIVLFVAVVIGIGLLSRSDQILGSTNANSSRATTTTTVVAASSTTLPLGSTVPPNTGDAVPGGANIPADVRVLVVNAAGGIPGVASKNGELLTTAGFNVVAEKNGNAIDTTTVYFASGFQADAEAVKAAVGVDNAVIAPAAADPLVPDAPEADVTVAFGRDYQG